MNLSDQHRAALSAFCDSIVPSLPRHPDPTGLWARSAPELSVPAAAEHVLLSLAAEQQTGLLQLLDGLWAAGLVGLPQHAREQVLHDVAGTGPAAAAGVSALTELVLFLSYGATDPDTGRNPMWDALGYPGPLPSAPADHPTLQPVEPPGPEWDLSADVVVVGSGAGGGVVAGVLAAAGLDVLVLEAGPYRTEADFDMLELPAYQHSYWRGGPQATADGNLTLLAGATLGGGTTINWTNCLRTRPAVRQEWAEAGLPDVVTADFDRHLDAVSARIGVTDACSDLNVLHRRLEAGARALGWHTQLAARNVDPHRYDPASGAYIGFGDQSGAKNSTVRTYLQDAADAGARIVVGCTVDRVSVEHGRAAGVVGTWRNGAGRSAELRVRAPRVVIAAGALESPAVLLRSGIGGPAVGHFLRVHPTVASLGRYDEDVKAWWGPPHTLLVDEFESGAGAHKYGYRLEGVQYAPGVIASAMPWVTGAQHKQMMEQFRYYGAYLGRLRGRGWGQVTLDAHRQARVTYRLDDAADVQAMHGVFAALTTLHRAAGATEVMVLGAPTWRSGDDTDAFLDRLRQLPLGAGGIKLFSAHQMGSCRFGTDPATSVAGPYGELHDVPGVWIGDGSGFPVASGTNPMLSIMAMAHRTAERIAADTH